MGFPRTSSVPYVDLHKYPKGYFDVESKGLVFECCLYGVKERQKRKIHGERSLKSLFRLKNTTL